MHEIEMPNYLTGQNYLYKKLNVVQYKRNCWRIWCHSRENISKTGTNGLTVKN